MRMGMEKNKIFEDSTSVSTKSERYQNVTRGSAGKTFILQLLLLNYL